MIYDNPSRRRPFERPQDDLAVNVDSSLPGHSFHSIGFPSIMMWKWGRTYVPSSDIAIETFEFIRVFQRILLNISCGLVLTKIDLPVTKGSEYTQEAVIYRSSMKFINLSLFESFALCRGKAVTEHEVDNGPKQSAMKIKGMCGRPQQKSL